MMVDNVNTFSVIRKKVPFVTFSKKEEKLVNYFSEAITHHFSMSEELAKAIGTVVVQALTENAKDEEEAMDLGGGDDLFGGESSEDDSLFGDDLGLDEDLPSSARDSGEAEEAEGPKNAPDLSSDFAELKKTVNNHSIKTFAANRHYEQVKDFLSMKR